MVSSKRYENSEETEKVIEEGKVPCPHCKGEKTKQFNLNNIVMEKTCLTCDDNGMVWWIDIIIKPQYYPYGYVRETVKNKKDNIHSRLEVGSIVEKPRSW